MDSETQNPRLYLKRWLTFCCTLAACVALTACGSSSSKPSGNSNPNASSSSSVSASSTETVAADARAYHNYLKPVTKINVSTPLKSPAPRGDSLVELGTSDPQNVQIQQEFAGIAKTYGWKFSVIQYDPANSGAFQSALNIAIQKHPDFINESGTPLTPSQIKQVAAAGIKLIPIAVYPIKIASPVIANPDSYAADVAWAKPVADYFISNSKGEGNALVVHVPAYSILDGFTNTFQKIVKSQCPGCTLKLLDLTLPQVGDGQENSAVVAALRSDPAAKYLIYDDGGWAGGIVSSLAAAGVSSQVQIIGRGPIQDQLAQIRAGKEIMWAGFNGPLTAIQAFDAMFRDVEGMPIPRADGTQSTQAITKANIGSATEWEQPINALAQYEVLWNK